MSPREKKLLTLFAIAGFVMLNAIGLSLWKSKNAAIQARLLKAERTLRLAEQSQLQREARLDEMDWLQQHMPEPAENQNVQTALQKLCTSSASGLGLEIKDEELLDSDTRAGNHFHRAKIRLMVTGSEESLYRWLDRVNTPDQMRHATRLIMKPNTENDTLIDCKVTIEQWFVPASPTA